MSFEHLVNVTQKAAKIVDDLKKENEQLKKDNNNLEIKNDQLKDVIKQIYYVVNLMPDEKYKQAIMGYIKGNINE